MKEQDEIDKLFSSSFDGFEKTPPLDVKAAIDARIFSGAAEANDASTKRRKGIIWWFVFAFLIGLSGLLGLLFVSNKNDANQQLEASNVNVKTKNTENEPQFENSVKKVNSKRYVETEEKGSSENVAMKKTANSTTSTLNPDKLASVQVNSNSSQSGKSKSTKTHPIINSGKEKSNRIDENRTINTELSQSINSFQEGKEDMGIIDQKTNELAVTEANLKNTKDDNSQNSGVDTGTNKADSSVIKSNELEVAANNINVSTQSDTLKTKKSPFSISIFGGTTYGVNSLSQPSTSNFNLKEALGFSSSVEVNYSLNNRFGISAGFDVNSRMDNFYRVDQVNDSVFSGLVAQYVYDPQNTDSIIDTLYVEEYTAISNDVERSQMIRHTSFAIPLAFHWEFYTKGNWDYSLATVVRLSYVNNKLVSNEHNLEIPVMKRFSTRLSLRPQVQYSFDKIAIGAYVNLGYDLIPTLSWTNIQRNRIDAGGGLFLQIKL